jgi:hypothetical protein
MCLPVIDAAGPEGLAVGAEREVRDAGKLIGADQRSRGVESEDRAAVRHEHVAIG